MNFERIGLLLHVVKETAGYPRLSLIFREAMAELESIAAPKIPAEAAAPITNKPIPIFPEQKEHDDGVRRI